MQVIGGGDEYDIYSGISQQRLDRSVGSIRAVGLGKNVGPFLVSAVGGHD